MFDPVAASQPPRLSPGHPLPTRRVPGARARLAPAAGQPRHLLLRRVWPASRAARKWHFRSGEMGGENTVGTMSRLWRTQQAGDYIAANTDIPIPKIHAYAIRDDSDPISSFIILEYISGEKLSWARLNSLSPADRESLHTSIADIYIQLRRLEFPSIGCLTPGPDGIRVGKKTMSIDINMQELEGLHPSKIQDSSPDKSSANEHIETLLQIAENALIKGRSSITDERGPEYLYHMSIFRQYAQEWVNPSLDKGPFVLVHGDFEPQNLIMTKDCKIAAVIDWEWSRVVPVQLFHPPLWLMEFDATHLAWKTVYDARLRTTFWSFNNVVRKQEMARYGQQMLYQEWEKRGKGGRVPCGQCLDELD
ncbi:hypothetical protein AK830_g7477 [Neonectria ditissima]|uniref:Aminoglycoside phosphotransferase domain-containing protein n=1 Tax=Neonectria ditissima TaxID=78410 RepID=A0A0P7BFA7_9HYPO|nr:hypothetical protein AK830_g7477 [Neonectria ditissima]